MLKLSKLDTEIIDTILFNNQNLLQSNMDVLEKLNFKGEISWWIQNMDIYSYVSALPIFILGTQTSVVVEFWLPHSELSSSIGSEEEMFVTLSNELHNEVPSPKF